MKKRSKPEDTPDDLSVVASFAGALFLGVLGGLPAILIFAFAAAQAILTKSIRARWIAHAALLGSGLPLLYFVISRL